jgi:ribosomal protein L40E
LQSLRADRRGGIAGLAKHGGSADIMTSTKSCSYCGSEIPIRATVCPVCKYQQTRWRNNLLFVAGLAGLIALLAVDAKTFESAGRAIGVKIVVLNASTEPELKEAFSQAVQQRADALLVHVDALFNDHVEQLVALAARHALPTMAATPQFTALGGLVSYGANTLDLVRQAGVYVGRILRGEKPADLPVIQPTHFALRVNLKTAKALGLSIPEPFLLLADEVIE